MSKFNHIFIDKRNRRIELTFDEDLLQVSALHESRLLGTFDFEQSVNGLKLVFMHLDNLGGGKWKQLAIWLCV